ncbi:MAG: hypothetical protein WC641_01980 [Patescibacteria group bacterium]
MAKQETQLISITPLKDLPAPASEPDYVQCKKVLHAIREIRLVEVRLTHFTDEHYAVLRYHGPKPETYWAKWISAQIGHTDGSAFAWLARISGIVQRDREIRFVPRPDRIDGDLAKQAREQAPGQDVAYIKLYLLHLPIKEVVILRRSSLH